MRRALSAFAAIILLWSGLDPVAGQTLRGSRVAMTRQNSIAREQDFTFLRTSAHVRKFVDLGLLVPVRGNENYELAGVSHPYARPALKTFIERLGAQYHAACGEKLVVTSLTRPTSEQPRNASALSVHPAGMAADLRVSRKGSCQRWLAKTLLTLEDRGLLDATRESRPPHFHVAVFPEAYSDYVQQLRGVRVASSSTRSAPTVTTVASTPAASGSGERNAIEKYEVKGGDSLWTIARRYRTTVDLIKEANNLRSSRIKAGQVLAIPTGTIAP